MGFFSFIVLLGIAYLLWRVSDQMPDLIFRLSEIQRDIAEIRRRQSGESTSESTRTGGGTPAAVSSPATGGVPESGNV
ncbi:MAG: hypothetical protein R3E82_00250 [Pseudomonadales bacterium]